MIDQRLLQMLACPQCGGALCLDDETLLCGQEHDYTVVDGIPVLLVDDGDITHGYCADSIEAAKAHRAGDRRDDKALAAAAQRAANDVDPYVQNEVVHTCGHLYHTVFRQLPRYPIPHIPLPQGDGKSLVDIGCNWGRWSIAAARKGYFAIGVDPSLEALQAAKRICRQLGVEAHFVVADARRLPFADDSVDVAFCYSVLQHFLPTDVEATLRQVRRIINPTDGYSLIQMANQLGIRQMYQTWKYRHRADELFAVRRYTPGALRAMFVRCVGPGEISVDGYFSLNAQISDRDLLPPKFAAVVTASEYLRRASEVLPPMRIVADSLYIRSTPR